MSRLSYLYESLWERVQYALAIVYVICCGLSVSHTYSCRVTFGFFLSCLSFLLMVYLLYFPSFSLFLCSRFHRLVIYLCFPTQPLHLALFWSSMFVSTCWIPYGHILLMCPITALVRLWFSYDHYSLPNFIQ